MLADVKRQQTAPISPLHNEIWELNVAIINGTAGNDTLLGTAEKDYLFGFGGHDTLNGGAGGDEMEGGAGDDYYIVDNLNDIVIEAANAGEDGVSSALAFYILPANVEHLNFWAMASVVNVHGVGNALDNFLYGLNGDDILDGGAGADMLHGGLGNDTYYFDHVGDWTDEEGGEGYDTVFASVWGSSVLHSAVEKLVYTGSAAITVTAAWGNHDITAGAGDDTIDGGGDADTMRGKGGNDTYFVDNAGDSVIEATGEGTDTVRTMLTYYVAPANVENVTFIGTGNAELFGNALANCLEGGSGNDSLNGDAGNDVLVGMAGDDSYDVGDAGDTVIEAAGAGFDTVYAALASYTLPDNVEALYADLSDWFAPFTGVGNALNNQIYGAGGADTLDGGAGADSLTGWGGDDTYIVDDAGDKVFENAGQGTDTVRTSVTNTYFYLANNVENLVYTGAGVFLGVGNGLANRIQGGSGNDVMYGGAGLDTLIGLGGNDGYWVEDRGDIIIEAADGGNDWVQTTTSYYALPENVETLTGGIAGLSFHLVGNSSANSLNGNSANDILDGGLGADTMAGKAGDDTYYIDNSGDTVVEAAGEGTDTLRVKIGTYVMPLNVENLILDTPSLTLDATGNALDNEIVGGFGNDRLDGGAGADTLIGDHGDDVYIFDNMGDRAVEGAWGGTDEVRTSLGSRSDFTKMFALPDNIENLTGTSSAAQGVYANALDNVVSMGVGGDLIVLEHGGNDTVNGGGGNDFVYYGGALNAMDVNDGGAGFDTLGLLGSTSLVFSGAMMTNFEKLAVYSSGGSGAAPNHYELVLADANVAAGKNLMVVGMSLGANETLRFDGARETNGSFNIRGGKGADVLVGGAGADTIHGNLGADELSGGGGRDLFEFYSAAESTAEARDTILDFTLGDKIGVSNIDADGNAANGNGKFVFIGNDLFSGAGGELRAFEYGDGWVVQADIDGDTVADMVINVSTSNWHMLGASDFYL